MNALKFTVTAFAITFLAACSTSSNPSRESEAISSKSFDYKAPPVKVRSLEIPPDLTTYEGDDRFGIPGEGDSVTRYSEFTKGGANLKASKVLPPLRNVRLERKGVQRWLVVNDKAENIWPVVKAFWEENGLAIKIENPQAGIIETEWADNRAKIPMDAMRKFLGKALDNLFSSGERDQYHTRLERSKDGNSTEIYISHYGMHEVAEKDGAGYRWLPRPSDPELEATMLQLLMNKLGGGSGVLDNTNTTAAAPSAGAENVPKLNKLADGSQTILINEPFDKSWRKIGLALDQAGIKVADKDRSKGIYFLGAGKNELKSNSGADKIVLAQVIVREVSSGCEVLVNNGAGSSNAETQKIVDALFKKLVQL